jgi:hypothetical protein
VFFVFVCSGYLGAQFRLRRELPCTRVVQFSILPAQNDTKERRNPYANYLAPGWFKFCLRRKLPAPGTKGGLFCICAESMNLT